MSSSNPSKSPTPPQPNTGDKRLRENIDQILGGIESKTVSDVRDAMNGRPGARTFGVDDHPREVALDAIMRAVKAELGAAIGKDDEWMAYNPSIPRAHQQPYNQSETDNRNQLRAELRNHFGIGGTDV